MNKIIKMKKLITLLICTTFLMLSVCSKEEYESYEEPEYLTTYAYVYASGADEYIYDDNDTIIEKISYDINEKIESKIEYEYDAKGNETERISYNNNGSITKHISEYTYNSKGNLTKAIYCTYENDTLTNTSSFNYQYDKYNREVLVIGYENDEENYKAETIYDDENKTKIEITYIKNGDEFIIFIERHQIEKQSTIEN